ncbi:sulfurtransferase complex subunit TusB [Marinimicrobium sp. ABcell2]|uniref:sulfurtransferase complex subunit TusB n=1 Tax=Marinimicrobium sp. ABcell2 TaxID=3069751 RepID=UPI0027B2A211|nr:sulfurtransferase complex subunit TusB [Marinimicrobium sp. ABcell2]MDQ2075663.1 sulfurtransferase complex subunit TusB [Marinimicrobium sp. ABcell2]
MSTLHTVNKSPFSHSTLASCLSICQPGDALLLIEDGVYGALASSPQAEQLRAVHAKGVRVYALEPDIEARGLVGRRLDEVELSDYAGFVRLSSELRCVQSWY